ncbi:OFA family MFS transporter [Sutterella sp.]|uniref:L-lactate MFS transporter n=1 Tax=Sutterella sp. TaxID=1981025 RepID=UPI0026DF4A1C|nr:OFA family MFS transporter [Sutterella sp.]MDO5531544.1 OFA family MFS transporter [Sutterella sp.]
MQLKEKRWILLAIACAINLCAGSIYVWSVFAPALAERLTALTGETITAGSLAVAFSLANAVGPVPMIAGGFVNDRIGPRWVVAGGGLLIGAGYALTGLATSPLLLVLSYGLVFGIGLGFVYGCTINATMKFFPDHRGLAGGLTTAVYGLSSVILPPVAVWLISAEGVEYALLTLALVFTVVISGGGLFLMKCPPDFVKTLGEQKRGSRPAPAREEVNWRGMLASRRFWPMILMLLSGGIPGMMVISHGLSIARELAGLSVPAAAGAVSMIALANVGGRIVAGAASDRFGRLPALCGALLLSIAGLLPLWAADGASVHLFWAGMILTGLSFGAFMGIYPGFTAEEFGGKNNSVNYGIMFLGFAFAGFVGPVAMGTLREAGLSYQTVCLMACALPLAGLVCAKAVSVCTQLDMQKR